MLRQDFSQPSLYRSINKADNNADNEPSRHKDLATLIKADSVKMTPERTEIVRLINEIRLGDIYSSNYSLNSANINEREQAISNFKTNYDTCMQEFNSSYNTIAKENALLIKKSVNPSIVIFVANVMVIGVFLYYGFNANENIRWLFSSLLSLSTATLILVINILISKFKQR